VISGFLDMQLIPGLGAAQSLLAGGSSPDALYGPSGSFYEDGHNPTRLVSNLAHSKVYVGVGDGNVSSRGAGTPSDTASNAVRESALLRPMTDSWVAAARSAGLDVTYDPHPGVHDWPDFGHDLSNIVRWGLFRAVVERPTSWVNDTVATHGELWGIRYRFAEPPARVVGFRRAGRRLWVGEAGSSVTLTSPGGCRVHVATPASVRLPLCRWAARRSSRTSACGRRPTSTAARVRSRHHAALDAALGDAQLLGRPVARPPARRRAYQPLPMCARAPLV
jgi:hypothetical protein